MDWIAAHEEANALQRALTPAIEAAMVATLGNPTTCPHGNPIPGSAPSTLDYLKAHNALRLSGATPDVVYRVLCISEVVEDELALLRYLGEKSIHPGKDVVLRDAFPRAGGPLLVEVAGESVALDRPVADRIWVFRPDSPAPDTPPGNSLEATASWPVADSRA
jgi:DtxR family Mn-dependent transcriptional regulator